MQGMLDGDGHPQSIFCIGHNITEFLNTQDKLNQASLHLDEISFIQSHGVRRPLANIMGIVELIDGAEEISEIRLLSSMLKQSSSELDNIIRSISNKKI